MRSGSTGLTSSVPRFGKIRCPSCRRRACRPRRCAGFTSRKLHRTGCRRRRPPNRMTWSFLATAMAASVMAVTPRPAPPAPSDTTSIVPVASSGRPYAPSGREVRVRHGLHLPRQRWRQRRRRVVGRRSGFGWQKIVAVVAVVAVWSVGLACINSVERAVAKPSPAAVGRAATAVEPSAPPPSPPQNESLATAPAPAAPPPDQNPQESVPDTHAGRDAASSDWEEIAIKMLEVAALLVVLFAVVYVMYRRHGRH